MKKHIFRSICFVAISVFLASLVLIMGVLYDYFSRTQQTQLRVQTQLVAQAVEQVPFTQNPSLEQILEADRLARLAVRNLSNH